MAPEPAGTGAAPGPASASANERAELLRMVEGLESDINALRTRLAAKPDAADGTLAALLAMGRPSPKVAIRG